jgi:predicted nucleotidyltransferase
MTTSQISKLKKSISRLLIASGVKRAAIFGSFARGDATKQSDIDLLIEFKGKNKSLFDLVALKLQLEEKLGRHVDLVTYNSLHPLLRDRIIAEQVIIL